MGFTENQKNDVWLRDSIIAVGLIIFGFLVIWWFQSCNSSSQSDTEFSYPATVLEHKTSIIDGNSELEVTMKLPAGWDDESDMSVIAIGIDDIAEHEVKVNGTEKSILFHIVGDLMYEPDDVYGNKVSDRQTRAFDIEYSMDDLAKFNWDTENATEKILNLGRISKLSPAGETVVAGYCKGNIEKELSYVFCANF